MYQRIVIFKSKHDRRYYLYSDETWPAICLDRFRHVDRQGGIYPTTLVCCAAPVAPDDLPTLVPGARHPLWVHNKQRVLTRRFVSAVRARKEALEEWGDCEAARNGDPQAAMRVVESRQDYEYESFTKEKLVELR